ncbi:MAG: hypothetical protein ACI9TF_000860 [Paracrocinitomix sp.]|jgi:hypothetical protein
MRLPRPLSMEARRADRRALAPYLGEPTMGPINLGLGHPCDHVVITRPFLTKTTKPRNRQDHHRWASLPLRGAFCKFE